MSDDLSVLLRPAASYRRLAETHDGSSWRRPLYFAFLTGCVISLLVSGRLTLRLVVPGALYASLIPLVEIAVLLALLRNRPAIFKRRGVDLFFMGHIAWCLWLLMLATVFAIRAFAITGTFFRWSTIGTVTVWSAYIDYCFFRSVTPGRAGRNLFAQRTVCWSVGLLILGGGSLWTGLLGILGQ